jgi:hypothetical protein
MVGVLDIGSPLGFNGSGCETYQADKDRTDRSAAIQLVPEHQVVEPVPFLGPDIPDDRIFARPLGGDSATRGDGHEKPVLGTFLVDLARDFAGGFPFCGADVLR